MTSKQKMVMGMGLVAVVALSWVLKLTGVLGDDEPAKKPLSPALELVRTRWNGMTAKQQHDVCSDVRARGAEVVADDLQDLFKMFSRTAHEDIVFFLDDLACKNA